MSNTDTPLDLDALERAARDVPLSAWHHDGEVPEIWAENGDCICELSWNYSAGDIEDHGDFIAAFDPPTVLALIRLARRGQRAEAILSEAVTEVENAIPNAHGGQFAKKFAANALRAAIGRIKRDAASNHA